MTGNTALFMPEEIMSLAAGLVTVLVSVISLLITTINHNIRNKKTNAKSREIYRLVKEQEHSETANLVKNTTSNIPVGLSEDEYFAKMKDILSELNYSKLKNAEENAKDNACLLYTSPSPRD